MMKNLLVLGIAVAILSPASAQHRHNRGGHYNHGKNRGAIVHTQRSPVQIRINVGIPVRRNPVYLAPRTHVVYNHCNSCNHNRGCNHNAGNRYGSYSAFEDLIYQMRNSSFESDKLIIAKQAVRGNGYSADQIGDIMMEFSYESSRLEFAKFAYGFCVNPEQYYQVNSAFQYSSSIDELDRFIH